MKVLIGTGPRLLAASEGDDFASLAAVRGERSGSGQPGVGVRFDADGRHVWISIDWLRHAARVPGVADWDEKYDAMIAYAAGIGWVDDVGTHVRAHLRPAS